MGVSDLDQPIDIRPEEFASVFEFSVRCELIRKGCPDDVLDRATKCSIHVFARPLFSSLGRMIVTRRVYSEVVISSTQCAMEKLHLIM